MEGECCHCIFDETSDCPDKSCFEVIYSVKGEVRLDDVIVHAGINDDRDVIYRCEEIPRVIRRWTGRAITVMRQSIIVML